MAKVKTAAALGFFDGVHSGHRAVLKAAAAMKMKGLVPCAFTFPPESTAGKGNDYIYGSAEKEFIMKEHCGIEKIYSPQFTDVCGMSGDSFARDILRKEMNVSYVVCGNDFRFGRDASCGVAELAEFGRKYGFDVQTVDDVCIGNERVSSTLIRRLLSKGEVRRAGLMLGEPYIIMKEIASGARIGRTIGFPTANQLFSKGQLVPAYGVYSSRTLYEGKWYPSMTNIGMKPTVGYGGAPLAETYISGFSGDLYGKTVQVVLLEFIRHEKRFSDIEQLRQQIKLDVEKSIHRP